MVERTQGLNEVHSKTEQRGYAWNAAAYFRGHNRAFAGVYPRRCPPRQHLLAEKTPGLVEAVPGGVGD